MRHPLLVLVLSPALAAQTWIVDAANGPGTDFTSIAAAVAAVPSGSTLLVRAGSYTGFSISGKSLTILGGPGVDVTQQSLLWCVAVTNLAAHQSVVIHDLRLLGCPGTVNLSGCAGAVLLEEIRTESTCPLPPMAREQTFLIDGCAQVMLRHSSGFTSQFTASNVVMENCTLTGNDAASGLGTHYGPTAALQITGGGTQLADCTLTGGTGGGSLAGNAPGIALSGDVRVLGATTVTAGTDPFAAGAPAIDGSGSARIDPAAVLNAAGQPPVAAAISVRTAPMPLVRASSAGPGGTLSGSVTAPHGDVSMLLVGFPGPAVGVPGIDDPFWLHPAAWFAAAVGAPQQGAPVTATVQVPGSRTFLGQRLAWQSVALTGGRLEASNPSASLVR